MPSLQFVTLLKVNTGNVAVEVCSVKRREEERGERCATEGKVKQTW